MGFASAVFFAALIGGLLPRENTGFTLGHIFISVIEAEACRHGRAWIIEVGPEIGTWSIFADSENDGLCVPTGLHLTPDGSRLLAADGASNVIRSFRPDGTHEILLDGSDGLYFPVGANCLAFDAAGDLYVVNAENSTIVRLPGGSGPAVVFADASDGIEDRGAIEFSPSGDLFYGGDLADAIIRIGPAGEGSIFDDNVGFVALAFDDRENLFAAGGPAVYRYDGPGPEPTTRRILAGGFDGTKEVAIALAPDYRTLYFVEAFGRLYAVAPDTGSSSLISDFSQLSPLGIYPTGATVYAPDPDLIPGRCCFALHSASPGCSDGVIRSQCGDDELGPFLFIPKATCLPDEPQCETLTGACCSVDPFSGCSDAVLAGDCQCPTCSWHESQACDEISCAVEAIPAASAWALLVLALLLMIGAKLVYAQRGEASPEA